MFYFKNLVSKEFVLAIKTKVITGVSIMNWIADWSTCIVVSYINNPANLYWLNSVSIVQEAAWSVEPKPEPSWPQKGEVEFRHYQLRYREGLDLVLAGITFTVHPCEKVSQHSFD